MIFKREKYLNELINRLDNGMVKIITGIRRVGKSFLVFNLFYQYLINELNVDENQIIKLSLDQIENKKYCDPNNLYEYLKSKIVDRKHYYILIDEIQNVISKKSKYTNELITFHHVLISLMDKADIYITGSNSKMLSNEIITEFRGRGDEIKVYPLSFNELYQSYENIDKVQLFNEYKIYGGLPWVCLNKSSEQKRQYLNNLFQLVYSRDIIEHYNIHHDLYILEDLLKVLASNISCLTNYVKLTNSFNSIYKLKLSNNLINRYLDLLISAFLISKCHRFDIKGNKLIGSLYKYYFSDLGIRNAINKYNQVNESGHIIENIVYNELIYRGFITSIGCEYKYSKDDNNTTIKQTYEIDFIIHKNDNKYIYIQVSDQLNSNEVIQREMQGLKQVKNAYKKMIIVNEVFEPFVDQNGILFINIIDFLINEEYTSF